MKKFLTIAVTLTAFVAAPMMGFATCDFKPSSKVSLIAFLLSHLSQLAVAGDARTGPVVLPLLTFLGVSGSKSRKVFRAAHFCARL